MKQVQCLKCLGLCRVREVLYLIYLDKMFLHATYFDTDTLFNCLIFSKHGYFVSYIVFYQAM